MTMVLKAEFVLIVYKQENEQTKTQCRDKTPKGEKLPKLKNN